MNGHGELEAQLLAMQQQIEALTAEVRWLRNAPPQDGAVCDTAPVAPNGQATSRRQLIHRGAVAIGTGLAAGAAMSRPAGAADPNDVVKDAVNNTSGTTLVRSSGVAADALWGDSTASTGPSWGLRGTSSSVGGRGVSGYAGATSGTAHGVVGTTESGEGMGVVGENVSTADGAIGVRGTTAGGADAVGVHGEATNTGSDVTHGVRGTAHAVFGIGVLGEVTSTEEGSKTGVFGNVLVDAGDACGVYGQVFSPDGYGVHGYNESPSGRAHGVLGQTSSANGTAILGDALDDGSSFSIGVHGVSRSENGQGVLGQATNSSGAAWGVRGETSSPEGVGVYGQATGPGSGVVGLSDEGFGAQLIGGRAAAWLSPRGAAPLDRSDRHSAGEVVVDADLDAWLCVAGGTPGEWRKLAGPTSAGAVHMINPYRAYDSRLSDGPLAQGASRVVSVKDGRDTTTGVVNAANVLPKGATGVFFNLTITGTAGLGFLATTPGDATEAGASSINWGGAAVTAANGTVVKLDNDRQMKVFAGGTPDASTHFIVDITGYTL